MARWAPDGGSHPLQYVFMDMSTYEETRVPRSDDWSKYMKEGMEVSLLERRIHMQFRGAGFSTNPIVHEGGDGGEPAQA